MLYLVGGPPRTGKSALGLAFLKARGVPWLSLDVMRTVLRRIVQEVDDVDGGFGSIDELVRVMRPFVEQTIEVCVFSSRDYLIEGVEIVPGDIPGYESRFGETRSCFLGNSAMTGGDLRAYRGDNPWHEQHTDQELDQVAADIRRWSARTAEECRRFGRAYVDMGRAGFEAGISEGLALLADG